jgi:hypothetical protein
VPLEQATLERRAAFSLLARFVEEADADAVDGEAEENQA